MAKLRNLREQLGFNKDMESIINVLKGVTASEFSRIQRERKKFDEFEEHLKKVFRVVDIKNFSHCFLDENSKLPSNIILITSDTGFLGKLNVSIVNSALAEYKENDTLTIIGRQGERYLGEKSKEFKFFPGISDYISFSEVEKLKNFIIKQVSEKQVNRTIIIYPQFISFAIQRVQTFNLLPCRQLFFKNPEPVDEKIEKEKVVIEPSFKRVVEYLVHLWIGNVISNIFWESKLSEWSARVIHLEGSSDEVKRQAKTVRLAYFRAIHENSDKSIREIFSSTLALRRTRW